MGKDTINIKETNDFNGVKSYLSKVNTSVDDLEKKLNDIGTNINNSEVQSTYNTEAAPVRSSITDIRSEISGAINHIDRSLSTYATADDNLKKALDEIYDTIFRDDDEEYERKMMFYTNEENKKLSYEEYVELLNDSEEFFKKQREDAYNKFYVKAITAGPILIKKVGLQVYNSIVETSYMFISDKKIGSKEYNNELITYKNKFSKKVLSSYKNLDFVPKCYLDKASNYEKSLLALSFDSDDINKKQKKIINILCDIDSRNKNDSRIHESVGTKLKGFYDVKYYIENSPKPDSTGSAKDLYEYYFDIIQYLKEKTDEEKARYDSTFVYVAGYDASYTYDTWYKAIKDTKAFQMIKDSISSDPADIYYLTNNIEFMSAVYQYEGMNKLINVYSDYYCGVTGESEVKKDFLIYNNIDNVTHYANMTNAVGLLYNTTLKTRDELALINDNEKNAILYFTKNLDVSDVTEEDIKNAKKKIESKWKSYCKDHDYNDYLEDWQIIAYAKVLKESKEVSTKLFNFTTDRTRGILDENIMQGFAYDVAKARVGEMTGGYAYDDDVIKDYIQSFIFSNAYGLGYGITTFTDGIGDFFGGADGKMNQRQMELADIMALLSGNYDLENKLYNNDPTLKQLLSSDYSNEFVTYLKNGSFDMDVDQFLKDCSENGVPLYELEYYYGMISQDDYNKYKSLASLSAEDLEYYAKLKDNEKFKNFANGVFKVSNSIGNMAIPVVLNVLSAASGGTLSTVFALASYASLFVSSAGKQAESMMQAGETNQDLIWTNALLHAAIETGSEALLGKVLSKTKLAKDLSKGLSETSSGLAKILNASTTFNNYLINRGCNKNLARYLSNILGEVIDENTENILGWGVDAASSVFSDKYSLPTFTEALHETWETTWMTALTTPILNGLTDISLSSAKKTITINGQEVQVSLYDLLAHTDEDTNTIDYKTLAKDLGIVSLELDLSDQAASNGKAEVPNDTLKQMKVQLRKGEKIIYDVNNNEFYRVDSNGNKLQTIPNDIMNNPNQFSRLQKSGDVFVDQITGREYSMVNFEEGSDGYNHIMFGETGKKSKSHPKGGHFYEYMFTHPDEYAYTVTDVDPETGVISGTWCLINSDGTKSAMKTGHKWFPAHWSENDISNAINTALSSDPVGIHVNREGSAVYTCNVNGVDVIVLTANGKVETVCPGNQQDLDFYLSKNQYVDLRNK